MRELSFRSRAARAGVLLAVVILTAACGFGGSGRPAKIPMPGNVPKGPVFASAAAIQERLGQKGLPCVKSSGINTSNASGSTLTCVITIAGEKFTNEISEFDPGSFSRDDIGDSIASRRGGPTYETIVAAGNWYVYVGQPRHAQAVATALGGVVLAGKGGKIPDYPLPDIPSTPRYTTVKALADALDAVVGCADRVTDATGTLTCSTGGRVDRPVDCATLALYTTSAIRDESLRRAIAYKGVSASVVTAGNWTVNLCDYGLATPVAAALQGVVVSYDGK
jgi:hypothetical protein